MNWNKMGKNIRTATNRVLSKVFGIMEPRLDKQAEKTLPLAEVKKNQAIGFTLGSSNIYPHNPAVIPSPPFGGSSNRPVPPTWSAMI